MKLRAPTLLRDRALYVFLGALVLGLFSLSLPEPSFAVQTLVFWGITSVGLVAGATAVSTSPRVTRTAAILAVAAIILRGCAHRYESASLDIVATVTAVWLLSLVFLRIARRVFDHGEVDRQKIVGAVTLYMLLGVIWGDLYALVEHIVPGAFHFGTQAMQMHRLHEDLVYYSFVSLTTVGFGDITAVSPLARSLTVLEAIVGVLFPNILIARLVSLEIMHSGKDQT